MSSRIQQTFKHKKAFLGYLTAGHTGADRFVAACLALVEGGVDLLEIGVPFTDPIADGPVIQKAMNQALQEGTTPQKTLELIRKVRERTDVPIVLFTYYNPILAGGKPFLKKAKDAGVDGILAVDLPVEEARPLLTITDELKLDPVFVVTPSTPSSRIELIGEVSKGFVYYACRKGTTGVKTDLPGDFAPMLQKIKNQIDLPVAAGFGIASKNTAACVIEHADGFVIGSAFVKALEEGVSLKELQELATRMDPR